MQHLHNFVLRISKWPVWLFFLAANLVFMGFVLNRATANLQAACDPETRVPDMELGYTPDDLREMLSHFTGACGETFRYNALVIDSFYPLAYGLFSFFTIVFLYYKGANVFAYRGLYLFALAGILFDYLENLTLAYLVKHSGNYPESCLTYASVFSGLKWLFAFISMALIVTGLIRWLMFRFRNR